MALIEVGAGVWYESFIDGQGAGSSNYFDYSADLDTNFETARTAINLLSERITAVGGPNALISARQIALNDADGPQSWPPGNTDVEVTDGFIGAHSYVVEVGSPNTEADISKGQLIMGGGFVELTSGVSLSGVGISGGAQDHYFSVDANGAVSISDTSGARDFATLAWDGTKYTGTMTRLVPVLMDGDAWRQLQERPSGLALPATLYEEPDERVKALERLLSGYDTDGLGNAIGPLALPFGAVDDPQVCFGASGSADAAGWYRSASGEWAYTDGSGQVLRIADDGLHVAIAGSSGVCAISVGSTEGVGFYEDTGGVLACAGAGVRSCRYTDGQTWIEDGTVTAPGLAFGSDSNTGIWTDTGDTLKMSTGGGYCFGLDPTGNLDLPLNSRCRTLATAQAVTGSGTGTGTNIDFDGTDVYDIGAWHDPGSNPDRHTCPTGGDGTYRIRATIRFLESTAGGGGTANAGDYRMAQITVNGSATDVAAQLVPPTGATAGLPTIFTVDEELALSAGDIVRLQADHDNGGTMDVEAECTISKAA